MAYLDGWPGRQRIWPWATALTGLAVSVAGNIGHIEAQPGQPVILADRLTAATSPVAAFAGLAIGMLILKMTRQRTAVGAPAKATGAKLTLAAAGAASRHDRGHAIAPQAGALPGQVRRAGDGADCRPDLQLLRAATLICQEAAARGERLSQRALAWQLREHGHRFPNDHLRLIAASITLAHGNAA